MAVVGEAHILVRAITTEVKRDIQRGFKGVRGQGTESGKEFGRGFGDGLATRMTYAQKSFSSLMRKGYVLQAGLGGLAGTVGALAGGIGALAGAALAAGSSLTIMANGMVAMKVATTVGGMALKGVSQAVSAAGNSAGGAGNSVEDLKNKLEELRLEARKASIGQKQAALDFEKAKMAYELTADLPDGDIRRRQAAIDLEEAKLNLDNAKQANKEAKQELERGPAAAAGGADPYAGLTKTQKEFAQYLVTIQSKMVLLREAAASSFLPELQRQIQSFITRGYMGTLVESFTYLSEGLSKLTADFGRSFVSTKNMRLLAETFRNVTTTLGGFGTVLGKTFEGFLYYLRNTNPLLNRFVGFLQLRSIKFADDQRRNSASIQAFFKVAGDAAADFGTIFSNLFERLGRFIGNVTGPGSGGQILLDWLKEASGGFRDFDQNVQNAISRKYFADTAENTKIILQSFDGLFTFLVKLGGNPAVGQFWENLQAGQGALAQMVTNSVEASPKLADILVNITKILAALSDSAQVLAFFETLNVVFTSIASMLKDMKPILDAFGPLIGTLSALGLIFISFKKAGTIIGGLILLGLKPLLFLLGAVVPAAGKAGVAMGLFSTATSTALKGVSAAIIATPVLGWIIGIVTAITAAGTALSMWSANTADQSDKVAISLGKSGASVGKIWEEAARTSWVNNGRFEKGAERVKVQIESLKNAQDNWFRSTMETSDVAGQFERLGKGLSGIFDTKGFTAASDSLKQWSESLGLSSAETVVAYREMDTLREQVRAYAEDLGVNVVGLNDAQSAQLEYNFLMQDTAYQTRMAEIAQEALNKTVNDGIASFLDFNAPLQQNKREVEAWAKSHAKNNKIAGDSWKDYTKDFEKTGFSLDFYLARVRNQVNEAANYGKNLRIAGTKLSTGAFTALAKMGKEGVGLVNALASNKISKSQIAEIEKYLTTDYTSIAASVTASLDPANIVAAANKKYGYGQGWVQNTLNKLLRGDISGVEAIKTLGLDITKFVSDEVAKNDPIVTPINAAWAPGAIDNLRNEVNKGFSAKPILLYTKADAMADGGSVEYRSPTVRAKSGPLSFASGTNFGGVPGVGGPRADNVPAMLSVGEFVVNAAAARRNMQLLTAINSGNASDLMADAVAAASGNGGTSIGITVNAAPGQSVDEIVSEVERRLAFSYRRGVSA